MHLKSNLQIQIQLQLQSKNNIIGFSDITETCNNCNKTDSIYLTKFYPCGDCGFRVYCQKCTIEFNWKRCVDATCMFSICENCKICCIK